MYSPGPVALWTRLTRVSATMWTLNKGGPKAAIIVASVLTLLGNWIRYAGTRSSPPRFGVVMFGQIIM